MKIDNEEMNEVIAEIYRRYKIDKEFDTSVVSECEYDDVPSSNKGESSDKENNKI